MAEIDAEKSIGEVSLVTVKAKANPNDFDPTGIADVGHQLFNKNRAKITI